MKLHNVANVNQLFTHLPNIDGFGVDTDDSVLVYLVGREQPIKVQADIELAVQVYEEEAELYETHTHQENQEGFTPFDDMSPEQIVTELQGIIDDIQTEKGANE